MHLMAKTIALHEADQNFSRVVLEVEAGEEFTITRDGKPVARLVPVRRERVLTPEQEGALARLEETMKNSWPLNAGRFNRDELYDEILGINGPKRRG
ncbi:MAG: type II toxin-antitoxin system Phd/YefM family antitoxin [Alphaproteobacteria bacterium]